MKLCYAVNTKPHSECYAAMTLEHVGLAVFYVNNAPVTACFEGANGVLNRSVISHVGLELVK